MAVAHLLDGRRSGTSHHRSQRVSDIGDGLQLGEGFECPQRPHRGCRDTILTRGPTGQAHVRVTSDEQPTWAGVRLSRELSRAR